MAIISVEPHGAERSLSWSELDDRANGLADRLRADGVEVGGLVAICLRNSVTHIVACVAAWKLGAVPVALRWDLPDWELERVLEVLQPAAILSGDPARLLAEIPLGRAAPPDAIALHRFGVCSSGSTGTPKVILHTAPGRYDGRGATTSGVVESYMELSHPQTLLVPNALYHSSSITTAVLNLVSGNHTVILSQYDSATMLAAIARHRVTGFIAPTPMLLRLSRHAGLAAADLGSLEWIQHGASPLPVWLGHRWIERIGADRFFTSYGSAEAAGVVACRGDEWLEHPGTLGRGVLGTEVAVLDDTHRPLGAGEVGEIYLRRPQGPSGAYYGRGVIPLRATENGMVSVGDLGWVDEDGYVFLADRRMDMIVTGGENVFPAELESALSEHPDIADVVVIGLPDAEWGKRVHAIVERVPGSKMGTDDVRGFARSRLAPYKVPKTVEFVEHLTRSAAMKLNRSQLVEARTRPPTA